MVKYKISTLSDGLFILLSSFFLFFTLLYYFFKDNVKAILISIPLCIIVFCLFAIFQRKKKGKLAVKKEDEERFIKCANALCLESDENSKKIVFTTLERLDKKPIFVKNGIICQNDFFFINFSYDLLSIGKIIDAYKLTPKGKNLIYVGINFESDCFSFAMSFASRITLLPLSDFFPLLIKTQNLPEGGYLPKKEKPSFLKLLKATFCKGKSKTFALYGSFLLIMSKFVFFPLWYIATGSLFLLYAITIKFFAPVVTKKQLL